MKLNSSCRKRTNRPRRFFGRFAGFGAFAGLVLATRAGGGIGVTGCDRVTGVVRAGGDTGRAGDIGRLAPGAGSGGGGGTRGRPSNRGFGVATVACGSGTQLPWAASGHGSTGGCSPVVPGMCCATMLRGTGTV